MESSDANENKNVDYRRDEDVYIDCEDVGSEKEGTEAVGISPYMYELTQTQNNDEHTSVDPNDVPQTSTSPTHNTNNDSNEGFDKTLGNADWCMW